MNPHRSTPITHVLAAAAGVLVLKVTAVVVSNYPHYLPPDFTSEFLRGREGHFAGFYRWAFYTHILAGPVTLVLGLALVSEWFRARFPRWHRRLGWVQVGCVLGLVTPSGLWMARYAAAGPVAGAGLAALAAATAGCAVVGTGAAVRRRWADHRRWMWRCYLLLGSAVVLRLVGGAATLAGVTWGWVDPAANWLSWLVPLAVFEVRERVVGRWAEAGPARRGLTSP